MAEKGFKRKLTAILSADAVEYSRLMGDDEEATVRTLTAYREVLSTLIQQHNGKVLDSPGDNLLAEFASVVDAVQCGVAVQKEIKARNDEMPEDRRMQFRIGINLGDVIQEEDRIYGDGVNVAARLEGLAEPGGICISKTAFDHIESKLPYGYDFIGDQTVKNIAKPVGAYRVMLEPRVTVSGKPIGKKVATIRRMPFLVGTAVIILIAVAVGIWQYYVRRPSVAPASLEKMAYPLPPKPSVAVLPFVNMSGDPGQEFFSDGLTDQIIASLSRVYELFVIARNSTFTYKGKSVKVQQVAEDLGVRYVLEGSVRKSEDRLRVTVQLIDALKGHHLWAEQYDREIKDIFAIQDDITMQVLRAMQVQLTTGPMGIKAKGTQNLQAYLKLLEAVSAFFQFSRDGNVRSRQLCEETIEIDPEYATAYGLLSFTHMLDIAYGLSKSPRSSLEKAAWYAKKAQGLDEKDHIGYIAMVGVYIYERDFENAIQEAHKAIELAPGAAGPNHSLARALCFSGRSHEAIDYFKKAIRIDPFPSAATYLELGYAYFLTGNYEDAVKVSKKACALMPENEDCHRMLAASYGMLGKDAEARAEAAELLRIVPEWSIEVYNQRQGFIWKNQEDLEHFAEGSRRAGLPEKPPLPLPDKPSVAVLPFVNMSGDPEQEYFCDGIADQIISAIGKIPYITVIARTSSFAYKGKSVNAQQIAGDLGVRYILEGSLQRDDENVRINTQLIDAKTGLHLWAENYDRKLHDIFSVQDEICKNIMIALQVKLTVGEVARLGADTVSFKAYEKYLKALDHQWRRTMENSLVARQLAQEAITLDPEYAAAYLAIGWTYLDEVWFGMTKTPSESIAKAEEMAQKAASIRGFGEGENALLSSVYLLKKDLNKAISYAERAVEQKPNFAYVHHVLAMALRSNGQYEEAILRFKKALQLNPVRPLTYLNNLAWAYLHSKQYGKAISTWKEVLERNPDYLFAYMGLTGAYWLTGREDQARQAAQHVLRINPKFSVGYWEKRSYVKDEAAKKQLFEAWRQAGLK
jgi:adenylate cyclase